LRVVFDWSGCHCDLHSFPTRRSSDLQKITGGGPDASRSSGCDDVTRFKGHHRAELHYLLTNTVDHVVSSPALANLAIDHQLHEQDRKSTRLNSSHVSISYAVFCLKKK